MNETRHWFAEVRVTCTDRGGHPSREITRLHYENDPETYAMFAELADGAEDEEQRQNFWNLYEADKLGYAHTRSNRRGDSTKTPDIIPRRDLGTALWRFPCRTCRRDVPISEKKLGPIVRAFALSGLVEIQLEDMHDHRALIKTLLEAGMSPRDAQSLHATLNAS